MPQAAVNDYSKGALSEVQQAAMLEAFASLNTTSYRGLSIATAVAHLPGYVNGTRLNTHTHTDDTDERVSGLSLRVHMLSSSSFATLNI